MNFKKLIRNDTSQQLNHKQSRVVSTRTKATQEQEGRQYGTCECEDQLFVPAQFHNMSCNIITSKHKLTRSKVITKY